MGATKTWTDAELMQCARELHAHLPFRLVEAELFVAVLVDASDRAERRSLARVNPAKRIEDRCHQDGTEVVRLFSMLVKELFFHRLARLLVCDDGAAKCLAWTVIVLTSGLTPLAHDVGEQARVEILRLLDRLLHQVAILESQKHGDEISEARLRALPFAVRCKDCEEAREVAAQRERSLAQRRGSSSLFYDLQG